MKKTSTQLSPSMSHTVTAEKDTTDRQGPKSTTVAFLRQFARCLTFENSIRQSELGALVLN